MDDNLEQPSFPPTQPRPVEDNADFSGDEDEGPDWTKFRSFASSSRPSLPKRGDKESEPAENGPTNLQKYSLNRAREAMFGALDAERGISNKSVSYAVWYSELARAHVTQARGVLFNGMGHSVPRPIPGRSKTHKRTELLPEESLYLIERGSLFCWKYEPNTVLRTRDEEIVSAEGGVSVPGEYDMLGSPMSVQQAHVEMIGRDDLTLERYHAYAYLKRLGFNVLRANPPSSSYPIPAAAVVSRPQQPLSLTRIFNPFLNLFSRLRTWMFGKIDWWKPLGFGWFGCARDYASAYRTLRFIPAGHKMPLHSSPGPPETVSHKKPTPYEIFYNVYKPNTPFRKSAPPPPDFSLVVVNARTTPLPSIHELTYLWSFLPETGPLLPRQRHPPKAPPPKPEVTQSTSTVATTSAFLRFFSWLFGHPLKMGETKASPPRKPHPFAVLKGGKKTIVIGVVDSGTVGFFRFGMGAFEEMPMI